MVDSTTITKINKPYKLNTQIVMGSGLREFNPKGIFEPIVGYISRMDALLDNQMDFLSYISNTSNLNTIQDPDHLKNKLDPKPENRGKNEVNKMESRSEVIDLSLK